MVEALLFQEVAVIDEDLGVPDLADRSTASTTLSVCIASSKVGSAGWVVHRCFHLSSQRASNVTPQGIYMSRITFFLIAVLTVAGVVAFTATESEHSDEEAAPIFGIKIPPGYRDWRLISVAHEAANLNDFRAILGNDIAINAYREGKLPFPDGTIIARLAWSYIPSEENNKVFGRPQSFVAGAPTNLQFMVKDSKKYASTGGWGFAQFNDGKPADRAVHQTCFACHQPVEARDFVFTRYAP